MKPLTLVKIRIALYTLATLGMAWQTSMNGVDWDTMGWEAQSCLIAGMLILWGNTMFAFFDKSMWRLEEERKATPPIIPKP